MEISRKILQELKREGLNWILCICTILIIVLGNARHNLFCIEKNENASEFYTLEGD